MPTSDFLTFATGAGANVESQTAYASDARRTSGEQTGIANSARFNKAVRQGTFIAAAIAKLIGDRTGVDTLDDGDMAGFVAKLERTLAMPTGVYVNSAQTLLAGYFYNVDTTAGALTVTLPPSPAANDTIIFRDFNKTWGVNPMTMARNGNTIMGLAEDMLVNTPDLIFFLEYKSGSWRLA